MTIKLVAFDLDGTLLSDNREVSDTDIQSLSSLKEKGIIRIAATGRNLYSVKRLLKSDFPMDYLVFSSGAGIFDWENKNILNKIHLSEHEIKSVVHVFMQHKLSFTINMPIPNTHNMYLKLQDDNACDLRNYTHFYKEHLQMFDIKDLPMEATQLIALINHKKELYNRLKTELFNLKVVLTTSPVDNSSLWVEVFNKNVSKANGVKWLCNALNINQANTFAIGNDYNDIDLLEFARYSYVVANAKTELKSRYKHSKSNNHNGFTFALQQVIDI